MTLSPDIQQQRYAAIELAYSERRWLDVEQLSRTLLGELANDRRDPLALRVVLLLGHTRLYGFGDSSLARTHYSQVLQHSDEQTLREIADQGLRQCSLLPEPVSSDQSRNRSGAVTPTAEPTEPAGTATTPATTKAAATPWLTAQEIDDTFDRTAAGNADRSADASPWLTSDTSLNTPTPLTHLDAAGLAADVPIQTADGLPNTSGPILAAEVIDEPEQVAVALAAEQQEPFDLVAATAPVQQLVGQQREGQGLEEQLVVAQQAGVQPLEARPLTETQPREAAAATETPSEQTHDERKALHRGLLRLKLD